MRKLPPKTPNICQTGVVCPLKGENAAGYHPESADTVHIEQKVWSCPANAETADQNTQELSDRVRHQKRAGSVNGFNVWEFGFWVLEMRF